MRVSQLIFTNRGILDGQVSSESNRWKFKRNTIYGEIEVFKQKVRTKSSEGTTYFDDTKFISAEDIEKSLAT